MSTKTLKRRKPKADPKLEALIDELRQAVKDAQSWEWTATRPPREVNPGDPEWDGPYSQMRQYVPGPETTVRITIDHHPNK